MQRLLKRGTVGAELPAGERDTPLRELQRFVRPQARRTSTSLRFVLGAGEQPPLLAVENLLRLAESSFSNVEVFEDCSGGNSRPLHPSGVGGGHFLIRKSCSLGCLSFVLCQ